MPARISREHLTDESLNRARLMLLTQVSSLGTLMHRYKDDTEVVYALKKDEDALLDVLGILIGEQRMRRFEDEDAAEYAAADVGDPSERHEEQS